MLPADDPSRPLPQTEQSIGWALAEAALRLTRCPTIVVVHDPATRTASVVAASIGTDRRLLGVMVAPGSAAGRACMKDIVTYGEGLGELLGHAVPDRRQREGRGAVLSILDGSRSVGAIVVFGPKDLIDGPIKDDLRSLANRTGLVIGRTVAARFARQLGLIDAVTGQPNRSGLDKAMRDSISTRCSLVKMAVHELIAPDTDAGKAVSRWVATVLRGRLRDYDVPARIGPAEFALFLPDASLNGAVVVADRVRTGVGESTFDLGGRHALTCSLGVASIPETVSTIDDLLPAAVSACEEARESGPNSIATLRREATNM
ncbi:MAG: GGDEF domain-containing protein [Gemmatimonadetes bacterium]|nr:GGDEF domain-containing protein [Gemmatimonadota bacterium]